MNYIESNNIAIVACPGGEFFADLTIEHLKGLYKDKFYERVEELSGHYNVDGKELIRDFNFYTDLLSNKMSENKNIDDFRSPQFKIKARFTYFMNGEFKTEILESIRGKNIFIFQDVENHQEIVMNGGKNKVALSVNDHLMQLIVTIDAVRHAGAGSITLVLPVYPYSRQHKKKGREGLTASLLGHLFENLGVKQIITLDIHSREIENCFDSTRLENLHASYQIICKLAESIDLTENSKEQFVVVSPDSGAVDRNKFYSSGLKKPLAMIYKERDYSVVTQNAKNSNIVSINLLGDVKGKNVLLADDMLGSGGTLLKAMEFLSEKGAKKVIAAVSLPFFNGNAIKDFDEAYEKGYFYKIIGTNAVFHTELKNKKWYDEADVSKLFAEVIYQLHENLSVGSLLDNRDVIENLLKNSKNINK